MNAKYHYQIRTIVDDLRISTYQAYNIYVFQVIIMISEKKTSKHQIDQSLII